MLLCQASLTSFTSSLEKEVWHFHLEEHEQSLWTWLGMLRVNGTVCFWTRGNLVLKSIQLFNHWWQICTNLKPEHSETSLKITGNNEERFQEEKKGYIAISVLWYAQLIGTLPQQVQMHPVTVPVWHINTSSPMIIPCACGTGHAPCHFSFWSHCNAGVSKELSGSRGKGKGMQKVNAHVGYVL